MEELFSGRYRLIEKAGSGGMANVFRAEDTILNRTVAIKMLHAQFAHDENFIARFRREAQAAAGLNHPNIVNIYDWGSHDDTYFIVMEYLEGENLKQIIKQKGALSPDQAIKIMTQVCDALDFAHKHDVVHRDIKPHNIIITETGTVKVTDFGIARAGASSMTQTGSIMGTATYISPEQAQGAVVGKESDVYSLGVVLYETLTGRVPFDGESPVAIAFKQVHEAPPSPRSINPNIPPDLERIVLKATSKNPDDRYLTAADMKADLNRSAQGLPVSAPVPQDAEKTLIMTGPPTAAAPTATAGPSTAARIKDKRRERRKRRIIWAILIASPLLVLLTIVILLLTTNLFSTGAQKVAVPNVKGESLDSARKILDDEGLKLSIQDRAFDENVPAGTIISQDPEWGQKIDEGSPVKVVVSKGPGQITVPDLVGKTEAQATYILAKENLELGKVLRENSEAQEDEVIGQDPESGTKVKKGAVVSITVSKGEAAIKVPDVVGKTSQEAGTLLGQAGLKMTKTQENSSTVSEGEIIRQSPSGGTSVKAGSTVAVVVSAGPETVSVPSLVGKSEADARSELGAKNLKVQVNYQSSALEDKDKVLEQNPSSGTEVDKNSTVTIKVGLGDL
jgi:serine/threonine protein kinase/beta-lactam-binding protein with PASTA domain